MENYFNELRWKSIRANNLLQFIRQVTIDFRFRKSFAQKRFKSNLEFRYQNKVSTITLRKGFAKFMIPIALFIQFSPLLRRAIKEESKVAECEGIDHQVCNLLQYIYVIDNLF